MLARSIDTLKSQESTFVLPNCIKAEHRTFTCEKERGFAREDEQRCVFSSQSYSQLVLAKRLTLKPYSDRVKLDLSNCIARCNADIVLFTISCCTTTVVPMEALTVLYFGNQHFLSRSLPPPLQPQWPPLLLLLLLLSIIMRRLLSLRIHLVFPAERCHPPRKLLAAAPAAAVAIRAGALRLLCSCRQHPPLTTKSISCSLIMYRVTAAVLALSSQCESRARSARRQRPRRGAAWPTKSLTTFRTTRS